MLPASMDRILAEVREDDVVLDAGGWARPFSRADWVIDLMPYETRGMLGRDGDGPQRFSAETWIERDLCDRKPFPFADGAIDFAVCSHTLEDLRDPVWVCSELIRIARAGYIEVPSRLEEQSYGVQGPWAGWSHHRWLIDVAPGRIEFVMKPHFLHNRPADHFPAWFHATLSAEQRVQTLWWRGAFDHRERVLLSAEEADPYVAGFVARHLPDGAPAGGRGRVRTRARAALRRADGIARRGAASLRGRRSGT